MSQTIIKSQIVPFSAKQMYALVNDVEKYPLFLPWCPRTELVETREDYMKATVHFAKGAFQKSFTTLNKLIPHERIEMRLVEGPFKKLEGLWSFEELKEKCRVSLHLSFEFNNKLLALALGPIFSQMANSMVSTFSSRANKIYGSLIPFDSTIRNSHYE